MLFIAVSEAGRGDVQPLSCWPAPLLPRLSGSVTGWCGPLAFLGGLLCSYLHSIARKEDESVSEISG